MKIKEVRELSTEELNNQVYSLKEQLFNLRRKKAVGNLDNMLELKRIRKDIARIYSLDEDFLERIKETMLPEGSKDAAYIARLTSPIIMTHTGLNAVGVITLTEKEEPEENR